MSDPIRLQELLRRWQLSCARGDALDPAVLCQDCPDLLADLRHQIAALRQRCPDTPDQNAPTAAHNGPAEAHPQEPIQVPGCTVEGELGRGGMGIVLRARELSLGRPLAVKVLLDSHDDNPQMRQRFLEEAQVMGQLQHPGVPAVHQLGQVPDGRPFFSMKLVRGQTLAQLLRERQSPADGLPRLRSIFAQVCETVAYAHSRGILHRDLKPSNIMVGAFGEVQVMDWGLARIIASTRDEDQATPASTIFTVRMSPDGFSSQAGTVVGTPAYMAIEQARGEVAGLDERADVFGLGAILCEVLTGEPPYRGGREEAHWQAARGELADAFARLQTSGADGELLALGKDCLAKDRDERPRDAGVVAERMTAYQRGVQERLRQAEMAQAQAQVRAVEERKRRRVQLMLAGVVLLLILAGGAGFWWVQQQRQAADAAALQAMAKARLLLDQAKAAALLDMGRFTEALSEAQKAEQLALTGRASAQVKQLATELVGRIGREKEAAQRDRRLLAALLEVRGPREGPRFKADERGLMQVLAEPSADEQFASAFRTWGMDVDATPVAAAVAQLKGRHAAVVTEVIAALDEWASERRQRMPAAKWQHLAKLAKALDNPDSRRRALRALLARRQLPLERALGALSMALRPVPVPFDVGLGKDRGRLRQLAIETDAAKEPVLGLLTLVRALGLAGDGTEAERLLRAALRARPQEIVLHHTLGQLLEKQTPQRWREALECYVAARALRPDLGERLAYALLKTNRAEEGLALYERLVEGNPSNPWLHFRRSHALYSQGRLKEAEAVCHEFVRLQPALYLAYTTLGKVLAGQGRLKEAEAAYGAAIRLKPDCFEAHTTLGTVLAGQGRLKDAEARHRKAIRLQPGRFESHSNLGVVLATQGRFKEAQEAYRAAIHLKPDCFEAHINLGNALADQGRLAEAEAAHREAIRLKPDDAVAHYNLGNTLARQDRQNESEAAYRQAIRLKPAYPEAHFNLGVALAKQARFKEAEAAFRQTIRLKPQFPDAQFNLGYALSEQDRFKEAEAAYRQAIHLKPDYARAHCDLGYTLRYQGRFVESLEAYRLGHALGRKIPGWRSPSAQWVRNAERLVELDAKLPAILAGDVEPATTAERLGLAILCRAKRFHGAAARFAADAFADEPQFASDLTMQHRYHAACSAALASAGKTEDAGKLTEKDRAGLRQQALEWLRADLKLYGKLAERDDPKTKPTVRQRLTRWQNEADLASVRDADALGKLSEAERDAWRELWADVEALRQRAGTPP
jgi:serine/threonine-protein kinase